MGTPSLVALAKKIARDHGLPHSLVCAVCEQESTWDPFAIRPESESGFQGRYGASYVRIVRASAQKYDDHWIKFEDVFYCSYGLMQTMYPVVLEMEPEWAGTLRFPTYLCEPSIGLEAGCRILAKKLATAQGNVTRALLHWNGGSDPDYPEKVLARNSKYDQG